MNVRIDLFTSSNSELCKAGICNKFTAAKLWYFPWLIAEEGSIYIMVKRISGYQNVSDIELCIQGTCNTGVDDSSYMKEISQNLNAEGSIYLADTAADNNNVCAV